MSNQLFDAYFTAPAMREVFSDRRRLQGMLDFEAALARAEASVGLVPHSAVAAIEAACQAERYDVGALANAIASAGNSAIPLVKAEMFPPQVRALGVGLAYAVANAAFGGSAEYVALGLKTMGMENTFYWYVTAMMAIAFLFSLRLPKQAEYLHHDH